MEAARNAVTGYTAVILALVCFVLGLMLIMAVVRLIVGLSLAASSAPVAQATASAQPAISQTYLPMPIQGGGAAGATAARTA